jgi:uncharacterized protein YxjI
MVRYEGTRYLARKKIFKMFGNAFHIYGASGELTCYIKQKAFKLKEAITVYADEGMSDPLMIIQARSIMDFSGTYDVTTTGGENLGALKRLGLKSIIREEWEIHDPNGDVVGSIQEDSAFMAIVRRFLSNLIPQSFTVTMHGQEVASFDQHFNPFVAKYDIDFSIDQQGALDRRLGLAAVVLLLAIEGRQN